MNIPVIYKLRKQEFEPIELRNDEDCDTSTNSVLTATQLFNVEKNFERSVATYLNNSTIAGT